MREAIKIIIEQNVQVAHNGHIGWYFVPERLDKAADLIWMLFMDQSLYQFYQTRPRLTPDDPYVWVPAADAFWVNETREALNQERQAWDAINERLKNV